jgi:hypothetical protein
LNAYFEQRLAGSRLLSLSDLKKLPWFVHLRNGIARLLIPYL